jgi:hypothetical protein
MTCPLCARTHPAPGALETTPPIPCGRCWASLSPAAKAPYLHTLRTSPQLAAFAHRDPFAALGRMSPAALAYVVHLEARIASHTRSTE